MNGKTGLILGIAGLGVGSALMYWFDPTVGRRRRAHARYEARRAARRVQKVIDTTSHGLEKLARMDLADAAKALVPTRAKALIWR
jgi:hypothetical protein